MISQLLKQRKLSQLFYCHQSVSYNNVLSDWGGGKFGNRWWHFPITTHGKKSFIYFGYDKHGYAKPKGNNYLLGNEASLTLTSLPFDFARHSMSSRYMPITMITHIEPASVQFRSKLSQTNLPDALRTACLRSRLCYLLFRHRSHATLSFLML